MSRGRLFAAAVACQARDMVSYLGNRNMNGQAMNDNDEPPVTIIIGRASRDKGGESRGIHVLLTAPDDDSAVRRALEALASEGYAEAELDRIGIMDAQPDEEPHASAWQGAIEGEIAIVTFDEEL